jgi:Predicted sugar nucleotidyltransferases
MKAIILCAGVSSRTQLGYPKCLYKFKDGEMLIEKNIYKLKKLGFKNKDIIFATGFKSKIVKNKTKNLFSYINKCKL